MQLRATRLTAIAHAVRRAIASFSPASLFAANEPGVWYDPSDMSTMFQDAAGTTPVTAVEQPVGRILDKSGRGNHATQTTATSRPVLRQDAGGRYYLFFDGIDDSLVTPTVTPGTDKVQVFAGVRKLSDAAIGMVVEMSSNSDSTTGSFNFAAPVNSRRYYFGLRGSALLVTGATQSIYAAPTTSVVTANYNFSGDINTAIAVRINSVSPDLTPDGSAPGTGNFQPYPLYIGRRGGTSLPFNGHLYSLAVRFGPTLTEAQITQTEQWVNSRTGAF